MLAAYNVGNRQRQNARNNARNNNNKKSSSSPKPRRLTPEEIEASKQRLIQERIEYENKKKNAADELSRDVVENTIKPLVVAIQSDKSIDAKQYITDLLNNKSNIDDHIYKSFKLLAYMSFNKSIKFSAEFNTEIIKVLPENVVRTDPALETQPVVDCQINDPTSPLGKAQSLFKHLIEYMFQNLIVKHPGSTWVSFESLLPLFGFDIFPDGTWSKVSKCLNLSWNANQKINDYRSKQKYANSGLSRFGSSIGKKTPGLSKFFGRGKGKKTKKRTRKSYKKRNSKKR